MSVLRTLSRAALPLSLFALLGAASCTSILGDDFEVDSDGGGDGSGSGSSSGGGGVCDDVDECSLCVCSFCEDDWNECIDDPLCEDCLNGDDTACAEGDTDLYVRVGNCILGTCSFECSSASGGF